MQNGGQMRGALGSCSGAALNITNIAAAMITPPALERLNAVLDRAIETEDLLGLFRTRLEGGPSVMNPPGPGNAAKSTSAPALGLVDLLQAIENRLAGNHETLREIASRF